jgi:predicted membrane-bound spermidine synthase
MVFTLMWSRTRVVYCFAQFISSPAPGHTNVARMIRRYNEEHRRGPAPLITNVLSYAGAVAAGLAYPNVTSSAMGLHADSDASGADE